jgi:hypothetical protein
MGAEKVELEDGCPYFYGYFDHRDVEIAERAFPGRRAVIEPHTPDETRWGNLKILPASADRPQARQRPSPAQELAVAAGRQGVRPLRSAEDLIQPGMFDSYEQMDEFLAELRAQCREGTGDA